MPALFVYGTLLDPARRAAVFGAPPRSADVRPAVLIGHRRVFARGRRYPVVVRARAAEVPGLLVPRMSASACRRVLIYEGSDYRRIRMRVRGVGPRPTLVWVFVGRTLGATRRAWPAGTKPTSDVSSGQPRRYGRRAPWACSRCPSGEARGRPPGPKPGSGR
ncbi:MAG: gamma-glutamylcyclotransferase family protein [Gemmatimonas sp.]